MKKIWNLKLNSVYFPLRHPAVTLCHSISGYNEESQGGRATFTLGCGVLGTARTRLQQRRANGPYIHCIPALPLQIR